jgi:hypothetical protein
LPYGEKIIIEQFWTFATVSATRRHMQRSKEPSYSITSSARARRRGMLSLQRRCGNCSALAEK